MPSDRRSRSAWTFRAEELITLLTCSATDRVLEIVTPRTLSDCTRGMFGRFAGMTSWRFLLLSWKMISTHLERFSLRLFFCAHCSTLSSSQVLVSTLTDGIITYVSSAYLRKVRKKKGLKPITAGGLCKVVVYKKVKLIIWHYRKGTMTFICVCCVLGCYFLLCA